MRKRVTNNKQITAQLHIQTIAIISLMMFMFFSCAPEAPQQEAQRKEEKKALIDTLNTQIDTSETTTLQRQSLTNLEEHVRQQSFHDLFTQTHYHTKVFIDRYTSQETANLQRYLDHPQEKISTDTVEATYYQIGELELMAPGKPSRTIVVDDKSVWRELRILTGDQRYTEQKSRFAIHGRTDKKISQFIYNRSRERMAEADSTLVVEGGANPMIFGPRKPITDYQRIYCDAEGGCFALESIVPVDGDNLTGDLDVSCIPCEEEKLHGSYDSLTIQNIIETNLAKPLPGDEKRRSFLTIIEEEGQTQRHLPEAAHQLFMMGLPALESTFEPDAKSPITGAAGPWQLMPSRKLKNGTTYRGKQQVLGEIYADDIDQKSLDMTDVAEQKDLVMLYQEDLYRGIQGDRDSLHGNFKQYPSLIKWMKKSHEVIPKVLEIFPEMDEGVLIAWYLSSAWIGGEYAPLWVLEHTVRQAEKGTPFDHDNPLSQSLGEIVTQKNSAESYEILRLISQLYRLEGKHSARQKYSSTYFFKAMTMNDIVLDIVANKE